jgi:hypothetical protein
MRQCTWSCVLHVSHGVCVKLLVLVTQDILSEELKGRLQDLIEATPNTADRSCLQQVLALLESWECRPQESATAVSTQA